MHRYYLTKTHVCKLSKKHSSQMHMGVHTHTHTHTDTRAIHTAQRYSFSLKKHQGMGTIHPEYCRAFCKKWCLTKSYQNLIKLQKYVSLLLVKYVNRKRCVFFFFPEVEVLLRKTLDKTGLLQRHFILTAERKQSLLEKQLLILSIPE